MGQDEAIDAIARDALETFELIARKATEKLEQAPIDPAEALAAAQAVTGRRAIAAVTQIAANAREGYAQLRREPAISRVVAEDEDGNRQLYYIARRAGIALGGTVQLAAYNAPVGALASRAPGDELVVTIAGRERCFTVLEKSLFHVNSDTGKWDSFDNNIYREGLATVSIRSLQEYLSQTDDVDADALARLLAEEDLDALLSQGVSHRILRAMALRDQPVLDRFQDTIFRLPVDSQLLILGPPGTGKTTTLIKRLGQKLDPNNLEEDEWLLMESANGALDQRSWIMFTPSELLKHYVKEAFGRENVPVDDSRIRTWTSLRHELARDVLGILKTQAGGRFHLREDNDPLDGEVIADPRAWFEEFLQFHHQCLIDQMEEGLTRLVSALDSASEELAAYLVDIMDTASPRNLTDLYRALDNHEEQIGVLVRGSKERTDARVRQHLVLQLNRNRQFLDQFADFLDSLGTVDEIEDDPEGKFDEDEVAVPTTSNPGRRTRATKSFEAALRNLARYRFLKRQPARTSKAALIRDWLGADRLPTGIVLAEIGVGIELQNGLRRFANASRRLVSDVPDSYARFRKLRIANDSAWYAGLPENAAHVSGMELDAMVLAMLRGARALLTENFVTRNLQEPRFYVISRIANQFRKQVLVDEATDFSALQLACMESLADLRTRSFFACGDFNQRVTGHGVRTIEQVRWISDRLQEQTISTVYRQSRRLNSLSARLLDVLGGDVSTLGSLPDDADHDGVDPVLLRESGSLASTAAWLADRIGEIGSMVSPVPSIAVLVNSEEEVELMATALHDCLSGISLNAVPCLKGQALGEEQDVRVFDVQHIKGLEFEAVFFAGIDRLAERQPELFGRFLYVGATRAATYLGVTCETGLPASLESVSDRFVHQWKV